MPRLVDGLAVWYRVLMFTNGKASLIVTTYTLDDTMMLLDGLIDLPVGSASTNLAILMEMEHPMGDAADAIPAGPVAENLTLDHLHLGLEKVNATLVWGAEDPTTNVGRLHNGTVLGDVAKALTIGRDLFTIAPQVYTVTYD